MCRTPDGTIAVARGGTGLRDRREALESLLHPRSVVRGTLLNPAHRLAECLRDAARSIQVSVTWRPVAVGSNV